MKKLIMIVIVNLLLLTITPAYADVYVMVDESGNAIGGAIVCDAATCGDPNSAYSKATLQPGQHYALQGTGTTGIGNNNPNTSVKVDPQTNVWSVTHTDDQQKPVSVETFTDIEHRVVANNTNTITTPITETTTVTDTATASIDTVTVVTKTMSVSTFDWNAFWVQFEIWFRSWFVAFIGNN